MRLKNAILILASVLTVSLGATCDEPNYIIPTQPLDSVFDVTYGNIRSSEGLISYLTNPTTDNFVDYTISLLPAAVPLWAMGVFMFFSFFICSMQMCCFDVCGKQGCGNEITTSTYSIKPIRCLVCCHLTFSVFVAGFCVVLLIVNSGLIGASQLVSCNTAVISDQLYNGTSNTTIPWAGVVNFNDFIQNATDSLVNAQPFLTNYFSSNNGDYTAVNINGSLYLSSQSSFTSGNCQNSGTSVVCPFFDTTQCPSPLTAVFNQQYCNSSFTGSALNLITAEKDINSTTWANAIGQLSTLLANADTSPGSLNDTIVQVQSFENGFATYEADIAESIVILEDSVNVVQNVLYVFYSFLLLGSIIGFMSVCCTYFLGKLSCKVGACIFWIFYFFMGVILFLATGFLLAGTFISFDSCQAIDYYFSNATTFAELPLVDQSLVETVNACYFQNKTTIFDTLNTTLKTSLDQIQINYANAIPSSNYASVVSTLQQNLMQYSVFPTTVLFTNQNSTNSAISALQQANVFANFSAAGSTQTCQKTMDYLCFSPSNCTAFHLITGQPPGNSCVVLAPPYITTTASGTSTQIDTRAAGFTGSTDCLQQGTTYENNANALWNYGQSIRTIVNDLTDIPFSAGGSLQGYETSYFQYYSSVLNFMSAPIQMQFQSILEPYAQLSANSSCGFVTTSLNGLTSVACNQLFPYLNLFTILNIVLAACIFILFSVLYFLIPRLEFFQVLEGNFDNWGEKTYKVEEINDQSNTVEMSDRNQEFLTSTDRQNV